MKKITVTGIIFEDPEEQPKLPLSLSTSLAGWKRPHEYLTEQEVYIDGSNKRLDRFFLKVKVVHINVAHR